MISGAIGAERRSHCRLELFREMNEQHTLFEIVTDKYAKTQMTHKRERPEMVRLRAHAKSGLLGPYLA